MTNIESLGDQFINWANRNTFKKQSNHFIGWKVYTFSH